MTSPSTGTARVLGSSQLYTAATILGAMLIPHVLIAVHMHAPVQPFTLHCVIVLMAFGLGMRAENAERAAAAAARVPRQRKKTVKKQPSKTDTLAWLDRSLSDGGEH